MADPAPTNIPNLSAADAQAIFSAMGGAGQSGFGPGQGVGQSYTTLVPAILQAVYNSGNAGLPAEVINTAPVQWLIQNGYLAGNENSLTPGWRSSGLTGQTVLPGQASMPALKASGAYSASTDVGPQGYGINDQLLIAPPNPFGVNTIGAMDVRELQSPTQNPAAFGTGAFGLPTVAETNLVSNTDIWSQIVPLMEIAASVAFGGAGGFGDLESLGESLFKQVGNFIASGENPLQQLSQLFSNSRSAGEGAILPAIAMLMRGGS